MLSVENIGKSETGIAILDGITFDVPDNAVTGVIGPNGAGKSTLLEIISGFRVADRGRVLFNGSPAASFAEKKEILSYMPERLFIYPDYYVHDFLDFIHQTSGYSDPALLQGLGLSGVRSKRVRHLSKGYHQRLKLYAALNNRKGLVILDEPFDGFDPIQLYEILKLIREAREKGRTFLLSIHQLSDAEKICDHFVLLDGGRLVAEGGLERLRTLYKLPAAPLERIFFEALK